ncbi:MAG: NAD-dependent epimerase/dehydratase family protein [Bacteriovoracia bacterium]
MKVLVTGSEGFVGKNLVEQLKTKDYKVLHPTCTELDLTDEEKVKEYLSSYDLEVIVHSATTLRIGTSYPPKTCENNLRMFFNLQKNLRHGVRLINFGSGSEYDRRFWYPKMPESFFGSHVPLDEHSYAKYLISKYIEDTDHENLLNLRIFGIYGRYEDYRYKFISNMIAKNILKQPITINANVFYDYVYIDDFVKIVELFLNKEKTKYKTFNITPSQPVDLLTLAQFVNKVSSFTSEIRILNSELGTEYSGDNTRLVSELGNFQFMSHEDSIKDLYAFYKGIEDSIDAPSVIKDEYLDYAKKLRTDFFEKKNEKLCN